MANNSSDYNKIKEEIKFYKAELKKEMKHIPLNTNKISEYIILIKKLEIDFKKIKKPNPTPTPKQLHKYVSEPKSDTVVTIKVQHIYITMLIIGINIINYYYYSIFPI
jgi:hypothetical protein